LFDPAYVAAVEGVEETLAQHRPILSPAVLRSEDRHGCRGRHLTGDPGTGRQEPVHRRRRCGFDKAARRIVGQIRQRGQTCIAPDFVLVHTSIMAFLERLAATIDKFLAPTRWASPDFGRIVNDRHFERLKALLRRDVIGAAPWR
jgi:aldehyde dehydrogenase (NAD+)